MSDEKFLAEIARAWVDGGGDAEGVAWAYQRLQAAVAAEIEQRNAELEANEYEYEKRPPELKPRYCNRHQAKSK